MIFNVNDYKLQVPYILSMLRNDQAKGVSIQDTASIISASIHVPLIAVYSIIAIDLGMTQEISDKIDRLKQFYHIKEIIQIENS